jgi:hypothetical protein
MIEEGAASQVMDRYFYRADYNDGGITPQELHKIINWSWRPSIFMPHEASRLFLEVKQVGIERVLDITEEDARMEGVVKGRADNGHWYVDYKSAFAFLWNHLNAKRGYPWNNNPWVWVYEFMRVKS